MTTTSTRDHGRSARVASAVLVAMLAVVLLAAPAAPSGNGDPGIQGGQPADPGEYPYMVALVTHGMTRAEGYMCGGSLIAPDTVLTAAHCVVDARASELDVVVGSVDLTGADGERVRVRQIRAHPRWPASPSADTAILQLTGAVSVAPVAVARPDQPQAWDPGRSAVLTGWGITDPVTQVLSTRLLEGTMPIVDPSTCAAAYGPDYSEWGQLCAGSTTVNACLGDSGSPLTVVEDGARLQVGIVSQGAGWCGSAAFPGIFTKVASRYERHVEPWLDPDEAPDAPRSLSLTPSERQVTVRWAPPYFDGGTPILGYRLALTPGDTVVRLGPGSRRAVVEGLRPGVHYTVTLTARNGIGRGAAATAGFVGR